MPPGGVQSTRRFYRPFVFHPGARVAVVMALGLLAATGAWAGTPVVRECYPAGGGRGAEVDVTFKGSRLEDARGLLFDEPGCTGRILSTAKGECRARIAIAAEAALGEHLCRVVTASGLSDVRNFYVSPYPLISEAVRKKGELSGPPVPVALGCTLYGKTPQEEQDSYVVEAKKGERITAAVIGARLQTQEIYDPLVRVAREGGGVLAQMDDTALGQQDPVLSMLAPEDGRYVVTVQESTNYGPGSCGYLLHLGHFVQPLGLYPLGGPAGEQVKFALLGDVSGPQEEVVSLPETPQERFPVLANLDGPAPLPNYVRVSPFPNVLESEPNGERATATAAPGPLPIALNGIIQQRGDVDYFKFTAQKGQAFDVTVYARQLRSPLDSVLTIFSETAQLATNDDDGAPDSHVRWTAPADGIFYLAVTDQLHRGGPLFTYRVEVTPVTPRFDVYLPEVTQNSSQDRRAIPVPQGSRYATLVRVKRVDCAGELELQPIGLPAGVKVSAGRMSKEVDTIPMVFEANTETPPPAQTFTIQAALTDGAPGAEPIPSRVNHVVDVVENGNQKAYYSVTEHSFALAVTEPAPAEVTLRAPKVPLLQNGSMGLKVQVARRGEFKGPVTLTLLYVPPGLAVGGTTTVKEGQSEGEVIVSANDKAVPRKWQLCVVATADAGGGPVWSSTELFEVEVAPPFVAGQITRTYVEQNGTEQVAVTLDRQREFTGQASLSLLGLPNGVTTEEQKIGPEEKTVKFTVRADEKAPPGLHKTLFCQFKLEQEGEPMTSTFARGGTLRVDKAATPAPGTAASPISVKVP